MCIFGSYSTSSDYGQYEILDNISFGALGQANVVCSKEPTQDDDARVVLTFACSGRYTIDKVLGSGLYYADSDITGELEAAENLCYETDENKQKGVGSHVNWDRYDQYISNQCQGKQQCEPIIYYPDIWTDTVPGKIPETADHPPAGTVFFAQVSCTTSEEELHTKVYWATATAILGLIICLFFASSMRVIRHLIELEEKELDQRLVSVEDYTMRGRIDKSFYKKVVETNKWQDGDSEQDKTDIRRFKKYLISEVQRNLETRKGLKKEDCKVADLSFAFDNREMLHLLKKRYKFLQKAQFEKV